MTTRRKSTALAEPALGSDERVQRMLGTLVATVTVLLAFPRSVNLAVVVLAACAVALVVKVQRRPLPAALVWGLAACAGSLACSTAVSPDLAHGLRHSVSLAPGALMLALIAGYAGPPAIHALFRAIALMVCGLGFALTVVGWQVAPPLTVRPLGLTFFVVPNDVCFLAVLLPAAVVLVRSHSSFDRTVAFLAPLLTLSAAVVLRSRLGVGLTLTSMGLAAALLHTGRRGLFVRMAMLAVVGAVLVDAAQGFELLHKMLGVTWRARFVPWKVATLMFADTPFLGHGPRTYALLYPRYVDLVEAAPWMDLRTSAWAHNLYLETLAEQGLLGLAALSFVLVASIRSTVRALPDAHRDALRVGARVGLLTFAVAALFEASLIRLWVVLAGCLWLGVAAALAPSEPEHEAQR